MQENAFNELKKKLTNASGLGIRAFFFFMQDGKLLMYFREKLNGVALNYLPMIYNF